MQYEIDIESLKPGDVIGQHEAEQVIGTTRQQDPEGYPLRLLELSSKIEASLWRIGRKYTVAIKGGLIRILTPSESSKYNQSGFDNGRAKMRKRHRHLLAVDVNQLTPDEKKEHHEAVVKQARVLEAVKHAVRKADAPLSANTKATPTLRRVVEA